MNRTEGAICRGELRLSQPERGYRFNVDSLILADFVGREMPASTRQCVDLGAGCGVVGLLLARRHHQLNVSLVEIQPGLAELARYNARDNGLHQNVEVMELDLRALDPAQLPAPQAVVSNPPFYRAGTGRLNPDPGMATARHEVSCTLADLCACAGRLLTRGGRLYLVHIMERQDDVLSALALAGFTAKIMRRIQPLPGREANRFLVMAEKEGEGGLVQQQPLLVRGQPGVYSEEMKVILRE